MPILLGEWPSNLKHDFHRIRSNDNFTSNGHQAVQLVMPTIVGGQHAVMPVAQLGNLGQVAIMSPSQVVVQQRNEFYLLFKLYFLTRWMNMRSAYSVTKTLFYYITHQLYFNLYKTWLVMWNLIEWNSNKWLEHMWYNSRRLSTTAVDGTNEARTEPNCDN